MVNCVNRLSNSFTFIELQGKMCEVFSLLTINQEPLETQFQVLDDNLWNLMVREEDDDG